MATYTCDGTASSRTYNWQADGQDLYMSGCYPVQCTQPTTIANFHYDPDVSVPVFYGSVLNGSCNLGYELTGGDLVRSCVVDVSNNGVGMLTGSVPVCSPVQCTDPGIPVDGQRNTTARSYTDVIQYECNSGFLLNGTSIIQCQANATWTAPTPHCTARNCDHPGHSDYISRNGDEHFYNRFVMFHCPVGFDLVGNSVLFCQSDGSWNSSTPSCVPKQCPMVDNSNAHRSSTSRNNTVTIVQCVLPSLGSHSNRTLHSAAGTLVDYLTSVTYSCHTGYKLSTTSTSSSSSSVPVPTVQTCQETGEWTSPTPPGCEIVTCPAPTLPEHGYYTPTSSSGVFKYQMSIVYQCDRRHYLPMAVVATCSEHGNWSDDTPTCLPAYCNTSFPIPGNAVTTLDGSRMYVPGVEALNASNITAVCDVGYESNNTLSTCVVDTWVPPFLPDCVRVSCPGLFPSGGANTIRTGSGSEYGDVHTFQCQTGYEWPLSSPKLSVSCQSNGQWSASTPNCSIVTCPRLTVIANGMLSSDMGVYNDTITGQCDPGYYAPSGNWTRTCQADGTWSGSSPSCDRVSCPQVVAPDNGGFAYSGNKFGDTVTFQCSAGYDLGAQASMLTCQSNAMWTHAVPTCNRVICLSPDLPAYPSLSPTQASITTTGPVTTGSSISTTNSPSTLATPSTTTTSTSTTSATTAASQFYDYGFVFTYTCDAGFYLQGDGNTTCSQQRSWTNPAPACHAVTCNVSSLPVIANGGHNASSVQVLSAGQSALWSCDHGYELQGDASQRCVHQLNMPGYFDGAAPTCTRVQCPLYGSVRNGIVSSVATAYSYQDVVQIDCWLGHEISANISSTDAVCLGNATWSRTVTACTVVSCGAIPEVPFAARRGNSSTFGSNVIYSCLDGYNMTAGSAMISCQDDKTWNGTVPTCSIVQCPIVTADNAMLSQPDAVYQENITLTCNQGYEIMPDVYALTTLCLADASYSLWPLPDCRRVSCGPLPPILNSMTASSAGMEYGDTAIIQCRAGYVALNTTTLSAAYQCTNAMGERTYAWTPRGADILQGSCDPVTCTLDSPTSFTYSSYVREPITFGDVLNVSCDLGHELTGGDLVRRCVVDVSNNGVDT
ncbi:sushi, von Willebrand factor type A, EGF and pentraxin domain-containing protein 1-like [Sycon ciliatum]|uniref:sushi, von Willebrand factor type A, EGF and pentraxin domain-containing protein 1-like n=1 Tax=Sycon ciliatum TaxID=27933 RepID=UPI0031F6112F